jgi:hypothetical protein
MTPEMPESGLPNPTEKSKIELVLANHEWRLGVVETLIKEQRQEFKDFMRFMRRVALGGFGTTVAALAMVLWELLKPLVAG